MYGLRKAATFFYDIETLKKMQRRHATCTMELFFKFHFCLEEWQCLLLQWGSKWRKNNRDRERKSESEKNSLKNDEISKMKENDNRGANHTKCFVFVNERFCLFHLDFHRLLWTQYHLILFYNIFVTTHKWTLNTFWRAIDQFSHFYSRILLAYQKSPPIVPNRPNHNPFLNDFKFSFNTMEIEQFAKNPLPKCKYFNDLFYLTKNN